MAINLGANPFDPEAGDEPTPNVPMAGVTDPAPAPIIAPAQSPEELAMRKSKWQELIQKAQDPNFRRAMLFGGASLAQPIPVGQDKMGHLANALQVGATAFHAGEKEAFDQDLKTKEETRKQQEADANVAAQNARTETENALRTSRVEEHKARVSEAQLKLNAAKRVEDVDKIKTELEQRRARLANEIPDEKVRKQIEAELDAAVLNADRMRATIENLKAGTTAKKAEGKKTAAEAGVGEITLDVLKSMNKDEQKEFLTKTGKYSTHISGIGQQASMWGNLYDKLPDDDPEKVGKTREQFQMNQLKSAKAKDVSDFLGKYLAVGGDDPEVIQLATEAIKDSLRKKTTPKAGAPAAADTGWTDAPGGTMQFKTEGGKTVWRKKAAAASAGPEELTMP